MAVPRAFFGFHDTDSVEDYRPVTLLDVSPVGFVECFLTIRFRFCTPGRSISEVTRVSLRMFHPKAHVAYLPLIRNGFDHLPEVMFSFSTAQDFLSP